MALSTEPRSAFALEETFKNGSSAAAAIEALDDREDTAPAIRFVDDLHQSAAAAGASDIHIEPTTDGGRVRQRVDGILRESATLSNALLAQVVSRVKLLAGMDISDKRQPQDGRYDLESHGRSIDARVSSMPTISGEKLVVRLLDMRVQAARLDHLGIPAGLLKRYRDIVNAPHGFVIACGPTGSGKTTTLYASLNERNVPGQHICTVEDPVEVRIAGVAQVQVNFRAGITFSSALRALLRQDPNVIMVGEMRDAETANAAMSAALSGQLVFTSLHAADATRTIERLAELGLKRQAIAAGLSAVVAQRLVRRLCERCKQRTVISRDDAELLGLDRNAEVFATLGCRECGETGYSGRIGLFELMPVNGELREAIAAAAAPSVLAGIASSAGYEPMLADGIRRVMRGETNVAELRRVLVVGESL